MKMFWQMVPEWLSVSMLICYLHWIRYYIELVIKCNVLFCFSNSVLCCGVIYFLVNLLTLLCLIPFYLSEHLCNVGQFDIWLQTHKTCTVGTFSTEDSPRERRGTILSWWRSSSISFWNKVSRITQSLQLISATCNLLYHGVWIINHMR